jgi:hypothetical protein
MKNAKNWKAGGAAALGIMGAAALIALAAGYAEQPVGAQATAAALPKPPADGVMGFVVADFVPPVIQEKGACPQGLALKIKDEYLASLPEAERIRLSAKQNEPELTKKWQATVFAPDGSNICSQPDKFDRPLIRTVQSRNGWGLDLDADAPGESCDHEDFTSPEGRTGVDNQEYRVMGCTLEWRGKDGIGGDQANGMRQFHTSGEWTQVILLRGVDSLQHDEDVEVIYANTADRPLVDSKGQFLRGASFSVSDTAPRHRNVLKGRIDNGVLTTAPQDIWLAQTWGQGGTREIRGSRSRYEFKRSRLRLVFQADGSLQGLLGGYRPVFDVINATAIGGAGSATVAGIDCAANLATLRKYADGVRDPKSGKCTAVSSAMRMVAVPAFVNDLPTPTNGATQ